MGMLREREREREKRDILLSREFDQWFTCSLLGAFVMYEFASVHPCPQLPAF